jgi:hypothetical protein
MVRNARIRQVPTVIVGTTSSKYAQERTVPVQLDLPQASENEFYALVRRWQGITDEDMAEARRSFDRRGYTGMYLSAA